MMLFVYYFCIYVLGVLGDASTFIGVVGGLTLYNSAVIAELVRSGVAGLPQGQREAGVALGLSPRQVLGSILLPQAVTAMLPSLISQLVVILKDTALGYIISYSELLRAGQNLSTLYGNLIPTLIVLAAIFIVINYALTLLARLVESRLKRSGRTARPAAGGSAGPATLVAAGGVGVPAGAESQRP
jgi:glutamate transport system permease protein